MHIKFEKFIRFYIHNTEHPSTIVIFVVLTFNIALLFFLLLIVKSSLQCATEIINLID